VALVVLYVVYLALLVQRAMAQIREMKKNYRFVLAVTVLVIAGSVGVILGNGYQAA